jgi:RNA polymerase sigma factor (TIGR02999 family)
MAEADSVTELLTRGAAGETEATSVLLPIVYEEMRRLAHRQLQREPAGHTLVTTDLVHQAYVRLVDQTRVQWTGRTHFMALAATAMRRILVDHARSVHRVKRGGGVRRVPLDSLEVAAAEPTALILELGEALDRLRALDPRQARVVDCRFFGGMTEEETAEAIGVSLSTVKRDWARARSWLYQEIYDDPPG